MTANQYNKIDNTYFLIEEKTKAKCVDNNVDFYNYLGVFKRLLINYIIAKENIQKIEKCDFEDKIATRAILNKASFASKTCEIQNAIRLFDICKSKLFEWLDKVNEPYFFILNPIYEYGAGIDRNGYGYKKSILTGTQNMSILTEYYEQQ